MIRNKSEKRSFNFLNQVKSSFIYKLLAILISFALVPIMIKYLGVEQYGIWATLLTIINLVIFFDFGIGNGTRNFIVKALSNNKGYDEVRSYISTGYISLFIFSSLSFIIIFIVSFFIDWQKVFNTENILNQTLQITVIITTFFILLNFALSISHQIYNAIQKASLIVFNQFLSNFIALLLIFLISKYTETNLIYLAFAYGFSIIIANLVISFRFFMKNSYLLPSLSSFDQNKIKNILGLGIKFFILQVSLLLIISSDKIIITQLLGPSFVTTYDVVYKYFSILLVTHAIINNPLWSTYTEAYVDKDYDWIKNTLKKMNLLFLGFTVLMIFMILFGDFIIGLWIGEESCSILVDKSIFIYMGVWTVVMLWYNTYAYFTNGIEKINYQIISLVTGVFVNIPLSIYFVKYLDMGLNGVILATIISLSFFGIIGPIQTFIELKKMKNSMVDL